MNADDTCQLHGEKEWLDCQHCGGDEGLYPGYNHDCGEDCCVCLVPDFNERCDYCKGKGGHLVCLGCHPELSEEIYG